MSPTHWTVCFLCQEIFHHLQCHDCLDETGLKMDRSLSPITICFYFLLSIIVSICYLLFSIIYLHKLANNDDIHGMRNATLLVRIKKKENVFGGHKYRRHILNEHTFCFFFYYYFSFVFIADVSCTFVELWRQTNGGYLLALFTCNQDKWSECNV